MGTGRGPPTTAESQVDFILKRLVVRLCSPSSWPLELLQRATQCPSCAS